MRLAASFEAVDLIDEEDRRPSFVLEALAGSIQSGPHLLYPASNSTQGDKLAFHLGGEGAGQGCLTGTRRSPEDYSPDPALLGRRTQWSSGTGEVILADNLVKLRGTESLGERGPAGEVLRIC